MEWCKSIDLFQQAGIPKVQQEPWKLYSHDIYLTRTRA